MGGGIDAEEALGGGAWAARPWGVLAALAPELGPFQRGGARERVLGVPVSEHVVDGGGRVIAAVSGVGKVAAAHGAAALVARGVGCLLVVGTCGGLHPGDAVGDLVHGERAVQWDLAVRAGREVLPDRELLEAWTREAGGRRGTFLTADRPALGWWARRRRERAVEGAGWALPVAEMETAAAARVAERAGVPWAALRVVSDGRVSLVEGLLRRGRGKGRFQDHWLPVAGQPAETVAALMKALA